MARLSLQLPSLSSREFRNYLAGSFISNVGNSLQSWTIYWHIHELTDNPSIVGLGSLMVGIASLVRVGPLLVLSLFGGVLADQADRRKVLLLTQSAMAAAALLLFILSSSGHAAVQGIYGIVALNACARAFDGPARQSLVPNLVEPNLLRNAISTNGVAWRLSDVAGPALAGVIIAFAAAPAGQQFAHSLGIRHWAGPSLCYLLNFLSFFTVLLALWFMPSKLPKGVGESPRTFREVTARIHDGLLFVGRTPVVRQAMWIDFWATLCSGAEALLPAFAGAAILNLGPEGFGILAGSSAFGGLLAAAFMSVSQPIHRMGRTIVFMIGLFGFFTICFGLSQSLWVASLSLALVGAADMVSTVLRQTLRQMATPDELRGRMSATASLFHISGPELGNFEAGAAARAFGERISVVLGGALCVLVAAHWSRAKALTSATSETT